MVNTRRPLLSYEPPKPPTELPTEIINTRNSYSTDQLQYVARYAEKLAEHKAREARFGEGSDDETVDKRPGGLSDDIPAKATITIKKANDNRYYYRQ